MTHHLHFSNTFAYTIMILLRHQTLSHANLISTIHSDLSLLLLVISTINITPKMRLNTNFYEFSLAEFATLFRSRNAREVTRAVTCTRPVKFLPLLHSPESPVNVDLVPKVVEVLEAHAPVDLVASALTSRKDHAREEIAADSVTVATMKPRPQDPAVHASLTPRENVNVVIAAASLTRLLLHRAVIARMCMNY